MSRFGEIPPVRSVAGNTEYVMDPVTGEVIERNKAPIAVCGAGDITARQQEETGGDINNALNKAPEPPDC